jgi:hypothetical protein
VCDREKRERERRRRRRRRRRRAREGVSMSKMLGMRGSQHDLQPRTCVRCPVPLPQKAITTRSASPTTVAMAEASSEAINADARRHLVDAAIGALKQGGAGQSMPERQMR